MTKVLLIDDSNTIRRSGELFLKQAGFEGVFAANGVSGLAAFIKHKPDIVFVDVMMPVMDGLQVCATIKSHYAFRKTPVVMLTSKDTQVDYVKGKLVGADKYLVKPFSKSELIDTVVEFIN